MDVITYPENLQTTSGLSILLHSVISLSDATSYDKIIFYCFNQIRILTPNLIFGYMLGSWNVAFKFRSL